MKTKNLLCKAFLLLALMGVGNAVWADANTTLIDGITLPGLPTGTYTGGTNVTHKNSNKAVVADNDGNSVMQASSPGYGSPVAGNFTWANACDPNDGSWSTTGTTWAAPDGSIFVGSADYNNSSSAHNVAFARRCNLRNVRTFAYRFTNCGGVSALVKSQGTADDAAACLAVYEVGDGSSLTPVETVSSKTKAVDIITVDGLSASKTYVAYIYGMNGSNGELYEVAFLAPSDDAPKLSASPSSVTLAATESGVAVNGSFTITGSNLADGTYDLTIPSVTGLSVSPTSFTVVDGEVSQVVSLSYSSTENVASNSVNITATVDELDLSVTVNYSASVVAWELQTISTAKTWDFSKLTGGVQYKNDDLNVEHVYANIAEIGYKDESFDKTALAFTGEYALREGKSCAQNGTLRFNTSVPGYIVIKFSDTGTSASATAVKRYLVINDETTEYWASRENNGDENPYAAQLNVTTDPIAVPAGDVTIKGTSALVYSKVEFTPVSSTVLKQITSAGWATLYTHCALDFSGVSGLTAYTATYNSSESTVTLNPVDDVPANTGVVLSGVADVYTIPVIASSETAKGDLKGSSFGCLTFDSEAAYNYYMLALNGAGEAQFTKLISGTIAAGKAYLQLPKSAGARTLNVVIAGGETTGISDASRLNDNGEMKNDNFFNLNGQRVEKPTKGLYIKNGKKVIIK